MITHVAIIAGGSHGLGRAMTLGLAREGYAVVAVGHIAVDIAQLASEIVDTPLAARGVPILADLRPPAECDRVMAATREHFAAVHILINTVGLTFTCIWPDLYRCPPPPLFWEAADEIVQNVIDTNYVRSNGAPCRTAHGAYAANEGRLRAATVARGAYREFVANTRAGTVTLVGLGAEVNMPAVLNFGIWG